MIFFRFFFVFFIRVTKYFQLYFYCIFQVGLLNLIVLLLVDQRFDFNSRRYHVNFFSAIYLFYFIYSLLKSKILNQNLNFNFNVKYMPTFGQIL